MRNTRPINWVKGALRDFLQFPEATKSGIATPKAEIDLVAERIKRLKEELKR